MDYRDLGRAGVKVSPICLGNMNVGGNANESTVRPQNAETRMTKPEIRMKPEARMTKGTR